MQRIFGAQASSVRSHTLAYLARAELSPGEIAARFDTSHPPISQHLSLLESAGLVTRQKRGRFVRYRQSTDTLVGVLTSFVQEACPVARPLRRESARLRRTGESRAPRSAG